MEQIRFYIAMRASFLDKRFLPLCHYLKINMSERRKQNTVIGLLQH